MAFEFNAAAQVESESQGTDNQPEAAAQGSEASPQDGQPEQSAKDILDLSTVEKFRYKDKEWTPKSLEDAILMQSDYTKKTQAIAEERKFVSNFAFDLDHVAKDPRKLAEFKSLYPEQYHAAADMVAKLVAGGKSPEAAIDQVQGQTSGSIPKEYQDKFTSLESQVSKMQRFYDEQTAKAVDSELDSAISKYEKEFPYADTDVVLTRAQRMNLQGKLPSDEIWKGLYEQSHKDNVALSDRIYKEKQANQKTASKKGFAGSPGGATTGAAPKTPRNIKEATQMLSELEGFN